MVLADPLITMVCSLPLQFFSQGACPPTSRSSIATVTQKCSRSALTAQ